MLNYDGLASMLKCCECQATIEYNPLNMCKACIDKSITLSDIIPPEIKIGTCFTCKQFFNPPSSWIPVDNEDDVKCLCMRLIKRSKKIDISDCKFVTYDFNSRRFKFGFTVDISLSEVTATQSHEIINKSTIVEFVMVSQICSGCQKQAASDYWNTTVQVRQHTNVKTTLLYLEQMLLKSGAHRNIINIKKTNKGSVDFFFGCKAHASTLVNFISHRLPVQITESKKLKGHDIRSNNYDYRYTFMIEIVPLCKNDIVILPNSLSKKFGNIGRILIVHRVTDVIQLIDPTTARVRKVDALQYFKEPFYAIASFRNLSEFMIMNIELCPEVDHKHLGVNPVAKSCAAADVYVLVNGESEIHVRTHLGNILKYGDIALGVNLKNMNCNNDLLNEMNPDDIPDVILIKKYYDRSLRSRKRRFKLRRLNDCGDDVSATMSLTNDDVDRQEFLENLEEDEEMRKHVNMFKRDLGEFENDMDDDGADDLPTVPLDELMGHLQLNQDADME